MSDWQQQIFPQPFFRPAPARVATPPITTRLLLTRAVVSFVQHTPFLLGVSALMFVLITAGSCACYVPGMIAGTISGWALAAWSLGTVDGHAALRDGRVALQRPLHAALGAIWFGVTQAAPAVALGVPVLAGLLAAIPLWQLPALALTIYAGSWVVGLAASGVFMARVGAARFLSVEHDVNPLEATASVVRATGEAWVPLSLAYASVMVSVLLLLPVAVGLYGVVTRFAPGSTAYLGSAACSVFVLTVLVMLWYGVLTTLDAVTYRALGYPVATRGDSG